MKRNLSDGQKGWDGKVFMVVVVVKVTVAMTALACLQDVGACQDLK